MAVCQNLVPLVNIKIAGKWMFIPLKMVLIGIDPYPYMWICPNFFLGDHSPERMRVEYPWWKSGFWDFQHDMAAWHGGLHRTPIGTIPKSSAFWHSYGSKCHPQPLMIGWFYGLWVTGSQETRENRWENRLAWPCGSEIPTRQAGLWTRTRNEVVLSANGWVRRLKLGYGGYGGYDGYGMDRVGIWDIWGAVDCAPQVFGNLKPWFSCGICWWIPTRSDVFDIEEIEAAQGVAAIGQPWGWKHHQ